MGSCSRANLGEWFMKAFGKKVLETSKFEFPKGLKVKQYLGYDEMNCDVRLFVNIKLKGGWQPFMGDWIILSCGEIDLEAIADIAREAGYEDKDIVKRIVKYGEFTEEEAKHAVGIEEEGAEEAQG